ncbi:MAG TPA: lipocalin family protein [Chryseosolibacter sp.]
MEINNKYVLIGGVAVLAAASLVLLTSCSSTIPEGASPVKPFDVKRYAGKWYEIARLDFKYEKGLNNTTADYSLNDDGTIRVLNRGYDAKKEKWKEATGKAKFADEKNEARLKVSFFGPFYSGYNVIAIDPAYQYALVAGESLKYLWLLSRETSMPENVKREYLDKAKALGYNTAELVWVHHDQK